MRPWRNNPSGRAPYTRSAKAQEASLIGTDLDGGVVGARTRSGACEETNDERGGGYVREKTGGNDSVKMNLTR